MPIVKDSVSSPRAEDLYVCNLLLYPSAWNSGWHVVGT